MRKLRAKRLAIGLVFLSAFLLLPTSHTAGALIAYYPFDEDTGQTAVDQTGNYHGTLGANTSVGADDPTWTPDGRFGGALSFDGGDYLICRRYSCRPARGLTIECILE